jgi:hypothetical protein
MTILSPEYSSEELPEFGDWGKTFYELGTVKRRFDIREG